MVLFASQTAHAFGERNNEPNAGGRAVKDDRRGGHPSAQTKALRSAEDGEGAAKGARASSLTGLGGVPKRLKKQTHRQVADSGGSRQHQRAGMGVSVGPATVAKRSLEARGPGREGAKRLIRIQERRLALKQACSD